MSGEHLCYVVLGNLRPSSGPGKKILSQLSAWNRAGYPAELTLVLNSYAEEWSSDLLEVGSPAPRSGQLAQIRHYFRSTRRAALVYVRRPFWNPLLIALRWVDCPIVLELNGPPPYLKHPRKLMRSWDRITFGWTERLATASVAVDPEIFDRYFSKVAPPHCRVIPNGVDLEAVVPVKPSSEKRMVMICSNRSPHHGFDRLEDIAALLPKWRFDVIGVGAPGRGHPNNVFWHGRLAYEQYRPLLERSVVGIGSLAWPEYGRTWNSALKIREYLAHGIAIALTERDPDVPEDVDWSCQLDVGDDVATIANELERHAEFWLDRRIDRSEVHSIDTDRREAERLDFFESVLRAVPS